MLEDRSSDDVRYAQFLAATAPIAALREIVEMLLAREIASSTWIGEHWQYRREQALKVDRQDIITPDPLRATLDELVRIVDRAAELAPFVDRAVELAPAAHTPPGSGR